MAILIYLLLVLLNEALSSGNSGKEHVHFKIHVPEIINHHIHTKTIFIHLRKPSTKKKVVPKKPEVPKDQHKDKHHSWSSWSSYDHHTDYEDKHSDDYDHSNEHKDNKQYNNYKEQGSKQSHEYSPAYDNKENKPIRSYKYIPIHDHRNYRQQDSYLPEPDPYRSPHDQNDVKDFGYGQDGVVGYSYPPQYAVHEKLKDVHPNEVDGTVYKYEKGYKKGFHLETGHEYSDQATKFQDEQQVEDDRSEEEQTDEDTEGRTHAGRYFIDDDEYRSNINKYKDDNHDVRRIYIT